MGVLSGWFLAGLAALAAPIVFHMIRRTPSGRVPFSTLMFLEPSPPQITKRSRIDQWPLLLLRALALTLLAIAFARPFLRAAETNMREVAPGRQMAVLLDTSASMQRAGMWTQAKQKALDMIEGTRPGDQIAIYAFDHNARVLMSFREWDELEPSARPTILSQRLDEVAPTWSGTDLGNALVLAAEDLESLELDRDDKSDQQMPRIVHLISDVQQGSTTDALKNYEWPETIGLSVDTVSADRKTNAGLELMAASDEDTNRVRVRVSNVAGAKNEEFKIKWVDGDGNKLKEPRPVYVPPARSRIVSFDAPVGSGASTIVLEGDAFEFDNTIHIDKLQPLEFAVMYIGKEVAEDPETLRFYLPRVFPDTAARRVRMVSSDTPLNQSVSMVVVADRVEKDQFPSLKKYVEGGGTVLYVSQTAEGFGSISQLLVDNELVAKEADVRGYSIIEEVDFKHPVFAPFSDAQFADFTRIHVWKHRTLPDSVIEGSNVLARFDDGDPAIVEASLGLGRVFLFATGWQPEDSQWAVSTKFLPVMNGLLEQNSNGPVMLPRLHVGEPLQLASFTSASGEVVEITQPDGSTVELAARATTFKDTLTPGVYQVEVGTSTARFAVNVDPKETNTEPMALETLETFGVTMDRGSSEPANLAAATARKRQLKNQELEKRQKMWRWLIVAAIAILLIETWLAGRITAQRVAGENPALQGGSA